MSNEQETSIRSSSNYDFWKQGIAYRKPTTPAQSASSSFLPGQITYIEKEYGKKGCCLILQEEESLITYKEKNNYIIKYFLGKSKVDLWQWHTQGKHKFSNPCLGVVNNDIDQLLTPKENNFPTPPYLVITTGVDDKLHIPIQTSEYLKHLKKNKIIGDYAILPTCDARKKYNEWIKQGYVVAGLFHLTC